MCALFAIASVIVLLPVKALSQPIIGHSETPVFSVIRNKAVNKALYGDHTSDIPTLPVACNAAEILVLEPRSNCARKKPASDFFKDLRQRRSYKYLGWIFIVIGAATVSRFIYLGLNKGNTMDSLIRKEDKASAFDESDSDNFSVQHETEAPETSADSFPEERDPSSEPESTQLKGINRPSELHQEETVEEKTAQNRFKNYESEQPPFPRIIFSEEYLEDKNKSIRILFDDKDPDDN